MKKLRIEENNTIYGELDKFTMLGNFHAYDGKITYARVDVGVLGETRTGVNVSLQTDRYGEPNVEPEISWPSLGASSLEETENFILSLKVATKVAEQLRDLVEEYNEETPADAGFKAEL